MPKSIRVKLSPTPAPRAISGTEDRENKVTGLEVALETRGKGKTLATLAPQPATLVFHLATFRRIRSESPQPKRLAELTGKLELRNGSDPIFVGDSGDSGDAKLFVYDDPELNVDPDASSAPTANASEDSALDEQASDPPAKRPRMLELAFSSGSFDGVRDVAGRNARLLLPDEVNDAHFLELSAELSIAGSVEAALDENDILDVRISDQTPLEAPHYELRLVDEVGESLQGIELLLSEGAREFKLRTDGEGKIFKLPVSGGGARVNFADPQLLKDLLREVWSKARGKPRFKGGPDVVTITPRDLESAIEVTTEAPVLVCIRPHVVLARLQGMFFDINKSFLLPSALAKLPELDELYQANKASKLLVVGHTDTTADAATNDPLSLERAESMIAYLRDDRDTWISRYSSSIPEKRRWGRSEDLLMLRARADFVAKPSEDEEIRDFQASQGLKVDGVIGPVTRDKLLELYMDRDLTTLPDDIEPTAHGCGENFPVDDLNEELDPLAPDATEDPVDRRVELFFFDGEFGILPRPPGKNSKKGSAEYPEWRRRSDDIRVLGLNTRTVRLFLLDSRYQRMKLAPYELVAGGVARKRSADENGFLEEFEVPITEECKIRWGRTKGNFGPPSADDPLLPLRSDGDQFEYFNVLNLKLDDPIANDLRLRNEARARLDNMGHASARFNEDFRAHRERYALAPVDAPFSRSTFDELAKVHREGTEAPLTDPDPDGPDTDPELFELDGEEAVDLLLLDDKGAPLVDQPVQLATEAGVVASARTDAQGRISLRVLDNRDFDVLLPGLDADAIQVSTESSNG